MCNNSWISYHVPFLFAIRIIHRSFTLFWLHIWLFLVFLPFRLSLRLWSLRDSLKCFTTVCGYIWIMGIVPWVTIVEFHITFSYHLRFIFVQVSNHIRLFSSYFFIQTVAEETRIGERYQLVISKFWKKLYKIQTYNFKLITTTRKFFFNDDYSNRDETQVWKVLKICNLVRGNIIFLYLLTPKFYFRWTEYNNILSQPSR